MDYLSNLPIDLFIKNITYLPFSEVSKVCGLNQKLHTYCSDPKYNAHWKALIDDTFSDIHDYKSKLTKIWEILGLKSGTYNYLVYTKLVELLDPITQLMIYHRQQDMDMFNDPRFKNSQRFLAMFMLGDPNIEYHVPNHNFTPFIDMLKLLKVSNFKRLFLTNSY